MRQERLVVQDVDVECALTSSHLLFPRLGAEYNAYSYHVYQSRTILWDSMRCEFDVLYVCVCLCLNFVDLVDYACEGDVCNTVLNAIKTSAGSGATDKSTVTISTGVWQEAAPSHMPKTRKRCQSSRTKAFLKPRGTRRHHEREQRYKRPLRLYLRRNPTSLMTQQSMYSNSPLHPPPPSSSFIFAIQSLTTAKSSARTLRSRILTLLSIVCRTVRILLARRLQLAPLQDVCHDIDVLVTIKDGIEQLLARPTHDSLGTLAGVEDVERVDYVSEGDGFVAFNPFGVLVTVDNDHEFVGGLRVGLVDDFVEGLHVVDGFLWACVYGVVV